MKLTTLIVWMAVLTVGRGQEQRAPGEWKADLNVAAKVTEVRRVKEPASPLQLVVNTSVANASGEDYFVKVIDGGWEIRLDEIRTSRAGEAPRVLHRGGISPPFSRDCVFLEGSGKKGWPIGEGLVIKDITFSPLAKLLEPSDQDAVIAEGAETSFSGVVVVDCYSVTAKKWEEKKAKFDVTIKVGKDGKLEVVGKK